MALTKQTTPVSAKSASLMGLTNSSSYGSDFAYWRGRLRTSALLDVKLHTHSGHAVGWLDQDRCDVAFFQAEAFGQIRIALDFGSNLIGQAFRIDRSSMAIHEIEAFEVDEASAIIGRTGPCVEYRPR